MSFPILDLYDDIKTFRIFKITILEYVHKRGIVYRDIKPDNFLLERDFPLQISRLAMYDSEDETPEAKIRDHKLLVGRKHCISLVDFGSCCFRLLHSSCPSHKSFFPRKQ